MRRWNVIFIVLLIALPFNEVFAVRKYIDGLPRTSEILSCFSLSKLREYLTASPLHHIEGIWRFPSDGTEVAIMRIPSSGQDNLNELDGYGIILIHSQNRALRPGTIIGRACRTAKDKTYEARIYTKSTGSCLMMPKKFTLQLNDNDTRIIFDLRKSEFSINLWRLLPYAWRYSVRRNAKTSSSAGCIRIFPEPELPFEPIYL